MTQEILVLGGGPIGLRIATELSACGNGVVVVDDETVAARARRRGLTAHASSLENATPAIERSAATVVVATPSDSRNLLLAVAAPRAFEAERVVALVNDPERRTVFEEAGIETVCVSGAVAQEALGRIASERAQTDDASTESTDKTRLRT
jgi:trk system potassium uptake protein TrkA